MNKGDENDVTYRRIKPFPYDSGNNQTVDGLNYTIGGKDSCKNPGGPLWIRKKIGEDYFGYLVMKITYLYTLCCITLQIGIVSTGADKDCGSLNSPG